MNTPKLSIIIPCYNMGEFIQETLDSVRTCPFQNELEIIIVNDGSNDEKTLVVLQELEEEGYFIHHQQNMGLAKARNKGIELAKGEFILPLDADNRIRPNYISGSIKTFDEHPEIDIVYGDKQHFDEDDKLVLVPEFDFPLLCEKNYIDACACFRKRIWEKLKGYDENMPVMGYEDWDFWLRASLAGAKFYKLDEVVFDYRVRGNSMISDTNKKYEQITEYIFNKPELRVVKSVAQANKKASMLKHVDNSKEHKIGKILLAPFRFIQKLF